MHNMSTDFEGAMKWVVEYHSEVQRKFLDGLKRVPSWGRHSALITPQTIDVAETGPHKLHQILQTRRYRARPALQQRSAIRGFGVRHRV